MKIEKKRKERGNKEKNKHCCVLFFHVYNRLDEASGKKGRKHVFTQDFLFVSLNTQQTHDKDRGRGGTRERKKK